jgi:hypothetical protein
MGLALSLLLLAGLQADLAPVDEKPKPPLEVLKGQVVDAIRNCPRPKTPDEIVVCARDRGIAEAYRLPRLDPRFNRSVAGPSVSLVGSGQGLASGDCSAASGSLGQTGCALQQDNAWAAERRARKKAERAGY